MLFNRKLTSALLREIYKNPLLFSYKKGRSVQNVLGFRLKLPDQWGSCFRCLACQENCLQASKPDWNLQKMLSLKMNM